MRGTLRTARYWAPIAGGFVCLVGSTIVDASIGWVLLIAAFGLILDGATAMWEKAGGTGNLTTYRQ
jgi:hypothetical protein